MPGSLSRSSFLFALCLSFLFPPLFAQSAAKPSDVFVVLDVSGSMRTGGASAEVKAYIEREVIRSLLRPGDRFTLIVFGSEARKILSRTMETEADRDSLSKELGAVRTDDAYTDLGTALETLDAALGSSTDGSRRPLALFITDGKNAPPPTSPYSGKDLSVDERFKDVGRKIAMKGWSLYVIGFGDKTDAPAVAAAVEGSVLAEASEALQPESLSAYVVSETKKTEERAAETAAEASGSVAAGGSGAPASGGAAGGAELTGKKSAVPLAALVGGAAAIVAIVLFFVFRKRKDKDADAA